MLASSLASYKKKSGNWTICCVSTYRTRFLAPRFPQTKDFTKHSSLLKLASYSASEEKNALQEWRKRPIMIHEQLGAQPNLSLKKVREPAQEEESLSSIGIWSL